MGKKNKTIWLKKRRKARLSQYDIVKGLIKYEPSINVDLYNSIEKGEREMPQGLVDIFNKMTNRKEENKLENMVKERDLDLWFQQHDVLTLIKEFGYSQKELADKLDLSQTTIWSMITGKRHTSREAKEKVYDFLTNNLNKKTDEEKAQKRHYKKRKSKNDNANEIIDVSVNNNTGESFTNEEINNAINTTNEVQETKFENFIDNGYEKDGNTDNREMTTDEYHMNKALELVGRLEKILADNDKDIIITKQKEEIEELKIKVARYEKIIDRL